MFRNKSSAPGYISTRESSNIMASENPYALLETTESNESSPSNEDEKLEIKIEGASVITYKNSDPGVFKIQSQGNVTINSPHQNLIIKSPNSTVVTPTVRSTATSRRGSQSDLSLEITPLPEPLIITQPYEPSSPPLPSKSIFSQINPSNNLNAPLLSDEEREETEEKSEETVPETEAPPESKLKRGLKFGVKLVVGFASGIVAGANTLTAPFNKQPNDIPKLWPELSTAEKFEAIGFASSSFLINFMFPLYFIDDAYSFIVNDLLKVKGKTGWEIARNIFIASLGIASAAASAVVAYDAVSWLGGSILADTVAACFTAVNFTTYLVSRTSGSKSAVNTSRRYLFKTYRDPMDEIENAVDNINHINKTHVDAINEIIQAALNKFGKLKKKKRHYNDRTYEEIFKNICTYLDQHPDLVNDVSTLESILKGVRKIAVGGLTLSVVSAVFVTFVPKGFMGFEKALHWIKHSAADTSNFVKILIGAWAGLASDLLYANSCMNIAEFTTDVFLKLCREKNIPGFIVFALLTAINGPGCAGMKTIAQSNLGNPQTNLFGFDPDSNSAAFIEYASAVGGFATNYLPSLGMNAFITDVFVSAVNIIKKKLSRVHTEPEPEVANKPVQTTADIYTLMDFMKKIDVDHIPEDKLTAQKKLQARALEAKSINNDLEAQLLPPTINKPLAMDHLKLFNQQVKDLRLAKKALQNEAARTLDRQDSSVYYPYY